jgi:hypothetical protein
MKEVNEVLRLPIFWSQAIMQKVKTLLICTKVHTYSKICEDGLELGV